MKIYTLTLNPAYDVHAFAKSLTLNCENLAQMQSREAGGKGVNISRALCNGRIPNTAIIVLGKENGDEFKMPSPVWIVFCLKKKVEFVRI